MDERDNQENAGQMEQNQPDVVPEEQQAPSPVPPPPQPSNKKFLYGMIGGGLLLAVIVILLAFNLRFSRQPNATQITPTPIPEAIVEPIEKWATYTVDEMSVKYSALWELEKPEEGIFITVRESEPVKGTFNPGKGWLEIVKSDKTIEKLAPRGGIDVKKDVEIAGVKGVRFEGSDTGIENSLYYVQVFLLHNNSTYKIFFFSQDKTLKDEFLKEFEQILSTVEFTP